MSYSTFRIQMADVEYSTHVPERVLVLAILERALADACANTKIERHIQRDAKKWLFDDDASPYTAVWWCEMIGAEQTLIQMRALAAQKDYVKNNGWIRQGNNPRN